MASSDNWKKLYPEIISAGGLSNALDQAFAQINSSFTTSGIENTPPFAFATVDNENKFSQVFIAVEEKLYLFDYWRDGVCLADSATNDLITVARTIDFWLSKDISIIELAEKYPIVKLNKKATAFEAGNEVRYAWNSMLQKNWIPELSDFIKLAINDEVLNKLFPFTSLYTLCFSRCTGYPYDTSDLPNVTPKEYANFCIPGTILKDIMRLAKTYLLCQSIKMNHSAKGVQKRH